MKKSNFLVRIVSCFCLFIAATFVWVPGSFAQSCEIDRWNAFMNANDNYTTTFRSWYWGDPVSCQTSCTQQCSGIINPTDRQQCVSNCVSNCNSTRYGDFLSAQDALVSAGNMSCPVNPDFCDNARYQRDLCNMTYQGHMQNPVIDPNTGWYEDEWWDMVITEYFTCRAASGIDQCE